MRYVYYCYLLILSIVFHTPEFHIIFMASHIDYDIYLIHIVYITLLRLYISYTH